MEAWLIILIVIGVLAVIIVGYLISTYNTLIKLRNRVRDQLSQIDVQLKRRFDLIPNIVETVKGYAAHEEGALTSVIEARNKFTTSNSVEDEMAANNMLTGALNKLFSLTESYPELKANVNFMNLQTELKETEDKIATTRMFYNDTALKYNDAVEQFPTNIIAGMFNFKSEKFFEVEQEAKSAPKVDFGK